MELHDHVSIWAAAAGVMSVVGGLVWKAGRSLDEAISKIYKRIEQEAKEADEKRKRIYERMDEIRDNDDKKFVNKEVCKILNTQLSDDLCEIKADVKELLRRDVSGGNG